MTAADPTPSHAARARRAKQPLSAEDRGTVFDLANALLVDPETGRFRPNTLLTDAQGDIRTVLPPRQTGDIPPRNFVWHALAELANDRELHPTRDTFSILRNLCLQSTEQPPRLFSEKGHFMRQVLQLARRTKGEGGQPLISTAEANRISDLIPLTRSAQRE